MLCTNGFVRFLEYISVKQENKEIKMVIMVLSDNDLFPYCDGQDAEIETCYT